MLFLKLYDYDVNKEFIILPKAKVFYFTVKQFQGER